MIGRMITRSKTLKRQTRQYLKSTSVQIQHAIDKYQLIKRFFIVGTVANIYFCYVSFAKLSIYDDISQNISQKFEEFNNNQTKNKEMVLELIREMDSMRDEQLQHDELSFSTRNNQQQNSTGLNTAKREQNKSQQVQKQEKKEKKQEKKGWLWFLRGSKKQDTRPQNSGKNQYI